MKGKETTKIQGSKKPRLKESKSTDIQITNTNRGEKSSITFTVKISKELIKKTVDEITNSYIKNTEIKGFRKGNAPTKLVFQKYNDIIFKDSYDRINHLINDYIVDQIKDLMSISLNKEFIEEIRKDQDIELNFSGYTKPKINKVNLKNIKIPRKTAEEEYEKTVETYKNPKTDEEKTAYDNFIKNKDISIDNILDNMIIEAIIDAILLKREDIPEYIITNYVTSSIDRTKQFTESRGTDINKYFKDIGTTYEKVVNGLEQDIIKQLKLDLFIQDFAETNSITVTKEDIEERLSSFTPDQIDQIKNDQSGLEEIFNTILYNKVMIASVNIVKGPRSEGN
ncbi:MAG: trigger factor [Patescibacteria group bacterium]